MDKIEEFTLERKQYIVSTLMKKELLADDVYLDYRIEDNMYILSMSQRPFVKALQDESVIAKYPSTNWQWFKSLFGLKHSCRIHRMNEHVTFPNYKFPEMLGEAKVYLNNDSYVL